MWNEQGTLVPREIDDPAGVESRRALVGLLPLADKMREMRELAARDGMQPPANFAQRRKEIAEWEAAVGWHA